MSPSDGRRFWRMRKLHQFVDAHLHQDGDATEVRYAVNGEFSYARRCPTRAAAVEEAAAKRAELERDGWNFHW